MEQVTPAGAIMTTVSQVSNIHSQTTHRVTLDYRMICNTQLKAAALSNGFDTPTAAAQQFIHSLIIPCCKNVHL